MSFPGLVWIVPRHLSTLLEYSCLPVLILRGKAMKEKSKRKFFTAVRTFRLCIKLESVAEYFKFGGPGVNIYVVNH